MPRSPICRHELARIENIKSYFRTRTCPCCGGCYKQESNRFALENFFFLLGWNVFCGFVVTNEDFLRQSQWLPTSFVKLAAVIFVAWVMLYWMLFYLGGKLIALENKLPLRIRFKQLLTYEPMFPDFRLKGT